MISNGKSELMLVNEDLKFQNQRKEKQTVVLLKKNEELERLQEFQKKYIEGLESILVLTSDRIQQPIANILGLSLLLNEDKNSNEELKVFIDFIKKSAITLDTYNKELVQNTLNLKRNLDLKT